MLLLHWWLHVGVPGSGAVRTLRSECRALGTGFESGEADTLVFSDHRPGLLQAGTSWCHAADNQLKSE